MTKLFAAGLISTGFLLVGCETTVVDRTNGHGDYGDRGYRGDGYARSAEYDGYHDNDGRRRASHQTNVYETNETNRTNVTNVYETNNNRRSARPGNPSRASSQHASRTSSEHSAPRSQAHGSNRPQNSAAQAGNGNGKAKGKKKSGNGQSGNQD